MRPGNQGHLVYSNNTTALTVQIAFLQIPLTAFRPRTCKFVLVHRALMWPIQSPRGRNHPMKLSPSMQGVTKGIADYNHGLDKGLSGTPAGIGGSLLFAPKQQLGGTGSQDIFFAEPVFRDKAGSPASLIQRRFHRPKLTKVRVIV
jgi:hypothetical protein